MDIYIIKIRDSNSIQLGKRLSICITSKEHYNLCKYRAKHKYGAAELENLNSLTNIDAESLTELFNKI